MALSKAEFASCTWIVTNNARMQAKLDATTYPHSDAVEYCVDPLLQYEVKTKLLEWAASSDKAMVVLVGIPTNMRDRLSTYEIEYLIHYWVELYCAIVYDFLRKRMES